MKNLFVHLLYYDTCNTLRTLNIHRSHFQTCPTETIVSYTCPHYHVSYFTEYIYTCTSCHLSCYTEYLWSGIALAPCTGSLLCTGSRIFRSTRSAMYNTDLLRVPGGSLQYVLRTDSTLHLGSFSGSLTNDGAKFVMNYLLINHYPRTRKLELQRSGRSLMSTVRYVSGVALRKRHQ